MHIQTKALHQEIPFIFALLLLAGCRELPQLEMRSIEHDGLIRIYGVYVPLSYTGQEPVPLVLALHGGNLNARHMERLSGFDMLAAREGFIVVYPNGLNNRWNDGREALCGQPEVSDVDDVGFIAALIDQLAADFNIDPARVYATGVSNGGMMSHRLACELTDRFAAIAPVSTAIPEKLEPNCTPSAPISVLMINGTEDWCIPWDGGYVIGQEDWGAVISVDETVNFWVTHNQCNADPDIYWQPDRAPNDGTRVWRETYAGGQDGAEVIFYGVEGGGHNWPGSLLRQLPRLLGRVSYDINASEIIWDFFKNKQRP